MIAIANLIPAARHAVSGNKAKLMNRRLLLTGLALATSMACHAAPAHAWEVRTEIDGLIDEAFYVDMGESSGSWTFNLLSEGVYADTGFGGIPVSFVFQEYDVDLGEWPNDPFADQEVAPGIIASAAITKPTSNQDPFANSAIAIVDGTIPAGFGYGAAFAFDWVLDLAPGSTVTLRLDPNQVATSLMRSEPGDDGVAFSTIKLWNVDEQDGDALGGVNNPYAEQQFFLSAPPAGAELINDFTNINHVFTNTGLDPLTLTLRLEGNALVFQAVPEPASALVLVAMGGLLLARRRVI